MSKAPFQVLMDEWQAYVRETESGPLFISFDVDATRTDLSKKLTHCARVIIPIQSPNPAGGPVKPESDRLWEMEEALCDALSKAGIECRFVGRLTHQGTRELVFQLADWDSFRPPVGRWMSEIPDYEIDVSEHEGWDFYDDCIRPSEDDWLFIADSNVVHTLLKHGSHPEKEHSLEFVFVGPADGLKEMSQELLKRGYKAVPSVDFQSGQVVLVKKMKLHLPAIVAESRNHRKLAGEHGVNYDGWGCQVVK